MAAFAAAVQALGMKHAVDLVSAERSAVPAGESGSKELRVCVAAFEARTMPRRERSGLVEEEQFGVARAPNVAVASFEVETAADPSPRHPAPPPQRAVVAMETPAAIAEEQAAGGIGEQITERIDAIGKRHRLCPTVMPALVAGIHVLRIVRHQRRGWPGQA